MKKILLSLTILFPILTNAQTAIKELNTGKYGFKNGTNWTIKPKYEKAHDFSDGLAAVCMNGKWGYIDEYGETRIAFRYDDAKDFSNGLAAVSMNGKYAFIDKNGDAKSTFRYDDAMAFSEGLAGVKLYEKWGFIDHTNTVVIPFKYDYIKPFSNGLASVKRGENDWGYIDKNDKWYDNQDSYSQPFSDYAKKYVEGKINEWQKKGKYEKTSDWQKRVNNQTRQSRIGELTREAEKEYIRRQSKDVQLIQTLHDYDADNEVFLIKDERFGSLLVPVPISDAPSFERAFYQMKRSVTYFVENDQLALAELMFSLSDGKTFRYNNAASVDYFTTNVDYRFAPIEIDSTALRKMQKGHQNIARHKLSAGQSDIDIDIPINRSSNDMTFAVVISNEDYKHEDSVPYARADGESFVQYCTKTLGIPDNHVHFVADATLNEIRMELNWLKDIGEAFGKDTRIIFYYSGHGVPDESGQTYLLPVDGIGTDVATGYELSSLYDRLGQIPSENICVFLDACFSGKQKNGEMLVASRGVAIKRNGSSNIPQNGNIVCFSACQTDETAIAYDSKGHGMFTYFLLKKLKDSKGNITLKELVEYVTEQVKQESVVTTRKSQTPSLYYTRALSENWGKIKLL